jgi:hypothetical protein
MIKVAAQSQRLLMIKWGRPAQLEEFLLPPTGGLEWRVPEWLVPHVQRVGETASVQDVLLDFAVQTNLTVLRTRYQSDDHGATFYNSRLQQQGDDHTWEPSFRKVFRDCWNVLFTPAPPIQSLIETFMEQNGLTPGVYAASHLRALYNVHERDPLYVNHWTQNAINCTSKLSQGGPLYFASDTMAAVEVARDYGRKQHIMVVSRESLQQPLHLDKAEKWRKRSPSEYYDTFVDLYLLAMARCVTFGMGGYGRWASYMSFNSTCSIRHHAANGMHRCNFQQPPTHWDFQRPERPRFRLPMPKHDDGAVDSTQATTTELKSDAIETTDIIPKEQPVAKIITDATIDNHPFPKHPHGNYSMNLWEDSIRLPRWMKDYFAWHREQRKLVNKDNWKSFRYLVVICLEENSKCGGTADRLRPIPFLIRAAAETKRILFITWEKPAPLEAFLVPPIGGIDWRTPDWLSDQVHANRNQVVATIKNVVRFTHGGDVIVRARVQAHDHGNDYYNKQGQKDGEPVDAFRQHYHDAWYVLFTPVPAIVKQIEDYFEETELVPGGYAFAHVRAHYAIDDVGRDPETVKNWSRNALNCVSSLRPGGPFFFSSDSAYAKDVAIEYGKERNTTVVARADTAPPLHLDLAKDWKKRNPAEFYDIFVDLYLMSFGHCMSYNMGGYGKWGLLLSGHDFTCNIRHWTIGVGKRTANPDGCNWTLPTQEQQLTLTNPGKKLERPLFLPPMDEVL